MTSYLSTSFYSNAKLADILVDLKFINKDHQFIFHEVLNKVVNVSPFVLNCITKNSIIIHELVESGYLFQESSLYRFNSDIHNLLSSISNDNDLYKILRYYRNREMVRIAWRDIAGWANIEDTMLEITCLAEAFISETLDYLFAKLCIEKGCPINKLGQIQNIVVVGMGKLGAWELNFSSDIDLIFFYESDGLLTDKKSTSYFEFYTKLVQSFIKAIDSNTENGFVFRVDTRLRPFGESGPIVMNYDGLEIYYQGQAREWERYAMVKSRVIYGDVNAGERLQALLTQFTYRRYLDYRAVGELRQLKKKINIELQSKDKLNNIKLGLGGIREIEFIGQVFQLIRGGRDKILRERSILKVFDILYELNLLPIEIISTLKESYRFLRTVENRLQQYEDKQTHDIPKNITQQNILASGLDYPDWESLSNKIQSVRLVVHDIFNQIIANRNSLSDEYNIIDWLDADISFISTHLRALGYSSPESIINLIIQFKQSYSVRKITARGVNELNRLISKILEYIVNYDNNFDILSRLFNLFNALAGRNVYYALLNENKQALSQLINLASKSSWIVNLISNHPILLDELLDSQSLYSPVTRQSLNDELNYFLQQINVDDMDELLNALRQFKNANILRIAAADLYGIISISVISDYLSLLAEVILEYVLQHAWRLTVLRHGTPPQTNLGQIKGFGIIAYGKLGGLELSYSSDLDLVFLYGGVSDTTLTVGENPIPCAQFYAKVVKRMVVILTTHVHSGTLYEIDLRLRPSGNSGLLVSSLEAYQTYQLENSWTWEQQALVRARFITGDAIIADSFHIIRQRSLCRKRDTMLLKSEVLEMRCKMRQNLEVKITGRFDLKQAIGCIADIEFIVQFAVLALSYEHHNLIRWTDVLRLLVCLQEIGFFSVEETELLSNAYCQFREQSHHAALLEQSATASENDFVSIRSRVATVWHDKIERT